MLIEASESLGIFALQNRGQQGCQDWACIRSGHAPAQTCRVCANQRTLAHGELFLLLWFPACVTPASVCVWMPRHKGVDGVPFVVREVTVYLPGIVICGCPSFNTRTRSLPEGHVVWEEEPGSKTNQSLASAKSPKMSIWPRSSQNSGPPRAFSLG